MMRRLGSLVVVVAVLGVSAPLLNAGYIAQVVAFGDSLSDTGNLFAASGQPPAPYYNGRFSNGPNWVDQLAGRLGVTDPQPSMVAGGTNYAWASAETGTGTSPSYGVPNLLTQVQLFTAGHTVAPNTLVTIWAGGNDFMDGQTNPAVPVGNIAQAIKDLTQVGGKQFLVANLPDLGAIPYAQTLTPAQRAGLTALTGAYNAALDSTLNQLQTDLNVSIAHLDVAGLFAQIQGNPSQYGFTNATGSSLDAQNVNGNGYLFWDGIHPTAAGHELIADAAATLETPEPGTLTLVLSAASFILWRHRRRKLQ